MANKTLKYTVKGYFQRGALPTESQFATLIDASANASMIDEGVMANTHLPAKVDLTLNSDASSLKTKDLIVIGDTDFHGAIQSRSNYLSLQSADADTPLQNLMIKGKRGDEGEVDLLTFNERGGFMSIPVLTDGQFNQDEIAGKTWVAAKLDGTSQVIVSEQERATAAEEQVRQSVHAEADTRETADSQLQANIDVEKNRIDAIESNGSSDSQQLGRDIGTETRRATAAEEQVQQSVNAEADTRQAADSLLQANIDVEKNRIDAIESNGSSDSQQLGRDIGTETRRATAAEEQVQQSVNAEAATRLAVDTQLQANINVEKSRVSSVLNSVQSLQATTNVQGNGDVKIAPSSADKTLYLMGNTQVEDDFRVQGVITPSVGNSSEHGIFFPANPGRSGGSEDASWLRSYAQNDEGTVFEMGTSNDSGDHIVLYASGNVGIGTRLPEEKLHVEGSARATAWNLLSDERVKRDIGSIERPMERISKIRGVDFLWNDENQNAQQGSQIGVLAQEVEKVFPEVVSTDAKGYKSVDYSKLIAPLIEAVKQLNTTVQQQQDAIDMLMGEEGPQ